MYLCKVTAPWPAYCVITVFFYQLSSLRPPSQNLSIYHHVLTKASHQILKHSYEGAQPMFQTYTPVGKSETQIREAIDLKIRVAGKTGMVEKIEQSALNHGIFQTNTITFVGLLYILVLLSSIDKSFQLVCSIEVLDGKEEPNQNSFKNVNLNISVKYFFSV